MGAAALLLLPYWLIKGLRQGKYLSNLKERLGLSVPSQPSYWAQGGGAIWIHAVSVGGLLSSVSLAKRLKEAYPERALVVSTTTAAGQQLARERMDFAEAIFYFPLDWTFCVRRVLQAVRPSLLVVLETEIWPNFVREARRGDGVRWEWLEALLLRKSRWRSSPLAWCKGSSRGRCWCLHRASRSALMPRRSSSMNRGENSSGARR